MPLASAIKKWLATQVARSPDGNYEHLFAKESLGHRPAAILRLKAIVSDAHADARDRLRRLALGTLDPLANPTVPDPAEGYPQLLHIQTLKGYFGEIFAGIVAENFDPFGTPGWEVPAHLFRFHLVEFQHLSMMKQTGEPAAKRPGRTGDDCLAFRRDSSGMITATLFCEGKCTPGHNATMITDAHTKSSLSNVAPVDLLQLIEILLDSTDPDAPKWIEALRTLNMKGRPPAYQRCDQITYVCGQSPVKKGQTTWMSPHKPHDEYKGGRPLHVAEIHISDVEALINVVYGVGVSP